MRRPSKMLSFLKRDSHRNYLIWEANKKRIDLDAAADVNPSRNKFRNLESVMRSKGPCSSDLYHSGVVEVPVLATSEVISPVKEVPVSIINDGSFPAITHCSFASSENADRSSLNGCETSRPSSSCNELMFTMKPCTSTGISSVDVDKGSKLHESIAPAIGLDLNSTDQSGVADDSQLELTKATKGVRLQESECASTTGDSVENEPMKRWNDLKQNSFLSSTYGGIPLPKPRKYQSKKRKESELRRNVELAKKENNSSVKLAAPTGLLAGLNPGIINHVRNGKQVRAIIRAMVKSAETEEIQDQRDNLQRVAIQPVADPESRVQSISKAAIITERPPQNAYIASSLTSECEDESLLLRLSSSGAKVSDNTRCRGDANSSAAPELIDSLSLRGANIASQWLDLIYQDLRGRQAALKRSRKRVRTAIQSELPNILYLASCENAQLEGEASETNLESHAARWNAIFTQMDRTLLEEGRHLENCLLQVKQMKLFCDTGLHYFSATGLPFSGSSNSTRFKDSETLERESEVMAAAASIYSTCEFATSMENVPCF